VQFITSLFGGSGNTIINVLFALGVVLVLIVLGVWLLKLLSNASGNAVRGRNRRLAVVDTLVLDQKRQLVIIRRDGVEHLILTGGPQDLVVETGIPVVEAASEQPARRPLPTLPARRPAPKPEAAVAPEPTVTAAPGTVLEQLQRAGHSGDRKAHVSLRHTGLLRPMPQQTGQNPDITAERATDSATQPLDNQGSEGAAFDQDRGNTPHRG
jgi:flagellar protein FliO/FliZ